jgi:hypothetical protein
VRFDDLAFVLPLIPRFSPARDTPLAREGRRLGASDRKLGQSPKDWPDEKRERMQDDYRGSGELMRAYHRARSPEQLTAPALWPEAIALVAAGTVMAHLNAVHRGWRAQLLMAVPTYAIQHFDDRVQRRAARRRGVTPENAPEARAAPHLVGALAIGAGTALWARARGDRIAAPLWTTYLVRRLVNDSSGRRAWHRAFQSATSTGRPDSSDATAASHTAAAA